MSETPASPPPAAAPMDVDADIDEDEERRQLLHLLNKITPTKFDKLCRRYLSRTRLFDPSTADAPKRRPLLRRAASAIAERAADDARYGPTHARLCARLVEADRPSERFRDELLGRIRSVLRTPRVYICEGEGDDEPTLDDEGSPLREGDGTVSWRRMVRKAWCVGHARFVGELLSAGVLTGAEVRTLLDELLGGALGGCGEEGAGGGGGVDELKLELFASMMSSSGAPLEALAAASSPSARASTTTCGSVEYYTGRARVLLDDRDRGIIRTSVRMKFVLMDLLEQAESGWDRRRRAGLALATTLQQIRRDAAKVQPIR